jgi:hypothetical protein
MLSNSYFFENEGAVPLESGIPFSHPWNAACVEECKPSNLQETYVAWLPKKNTLLKQESRKKPSGNKRNSAISRTQKKEGKKERRKNPVTDDHNMNYKEKRNNPDKLMLQ